jgi:hypothetical protein
MKRPILLAGLLFAAVCLTSCDYILEGVTNADSSPLAQSDDATIRAAADSSEATRIERESRDHFTEGREHRNPHEIEEAIKLKPLDLRYRAHQLALLLAFDLHPGDGASKQESQLYEQYRGSFGRAWEDMVAALDHQTPPGVSARSQFVYFLSYYLPALQETVGKFAPDSRESQRIQAWVCIFRYSLAQSEDPLAPLILAANPYSLECSY